MILNRDSPIRLISTMDLDQACRISVREHTGIKHRYVVTVTFAPIGRAFFRSGRTAAPVLAVPAN